MSAPRSICFLYSAKNLDIDDLLANDEIVVTCDAWAGLEKAVDSGTLGTLNSRAYRYIDIWGAGYRTSADKAAYGVATWAPGPGDVYEHLPKIRSARNPYPYRFDRFHPGQFLAWCKNIISAAPNCRGVFLDDWTDPPEWWGLTPAQRRIVWPNGWWTIAAGGFYRWTANRMREIEHGLYAMSRGRRESRQVIFNGDRRTAGPRCWESYGKWVDPIEVEQEARLNDIVIVKALDSDGEFLPGWRETFRKALSVSRRKGLRLSLAYEERPEGGGSVFSMHKYSDPETWGEI